jgi:hypothetical protein
MKSIANTSRWLSLASACGIITLAVSAQADKPVKPPKPEPSGGLTFASLDAGNLGAGSFIRPRAINDSGTIVGVVTIADTHAAFLLHPEGSSYFADDNADGANDLIQILPAAGPADAYDINNQGQVVGCEEVDGVKIGLLWDAAGVTVLLPGGCARGINDAGVVAGYVGNDEWGPTVAVVVMDGVVYQVAANDSFPLFGYVGVDVMDDLSVIVNALGAANYAAVVRPDFADADGDGNPWWADENGDGLNDRLIDFPPNSTATAKAGTGSGICAGDANDRAALFDAAMPVPVYIDLGAPRRSRTYAYDANDAGWTVGVVIPANKSDYGAFWQDGQLFKFADIVTSGPIGSPRVINHSGVIAGHVDGRLFVAIPSAEP